MAAEPSYISNRSEIVRPNERKRALYFARTKPNLVSILCVVFVRSYVHSFFYFYFILLFILFASILTAAWWYLKPLTQMKYFSAVPPRHAETE